MSHDTYTLQFLFVSYLSDLFIFWGILLWFLKWNCFCFVLFFILIFNTFLYWLIRRCHLDFRGKDRLAQTVFNIVDHQMNQLHYSRTPQYISKIVEHSVSRWIIWVSHAADVFELLRFQDSDIRPLAWRKLFPDKKKKSWKKTTKPCVKLSLGKTLNSMFDFVVIDWHQC